MQESQLLELIKAKIDTLIPELNQKYSEEARAAIEHTNQGFSIPTGAMISAVNDACVQGIKDRSLAIVEIMKDIISDLNYFPSNQLATNLKRILENCLPENLNEFRIHANYDAPVQTTQVFDQSFYKARKIALQSSFVEIDLFIESQLRKNSITNSISLSEDLFLLLSSMVEADRKMPKEKRTNFFVHKEPIGNPDVMIHNGLSKDFRFRFSDLEELASDGLVAIKGTDRTPQAYVTQKGYKYHDEVRSESSSYVASPRLSGKSVVVDRTLNDALELIKTSGPTSAVDRLHTALHGYFKDICKETNIQIEPDDTLPSIFKKLRTHHPALINDPLYQQDISKVINAFASVIDTLNTFRNNLTPSHPNEELLPESEAILMINCVRTILTYFEGKLCPKSP